MAMRLATEATADAPTTPTMGAEVLGRIPLFAGLDADDRAALWGMMKAERFGPQQPVIWIGETGTDFYVVQHGAVIVVAPNEVGEEVTLANLGPGQFFGELSLLDGGPRTASVRSITESTLLILSREEFQAFIVSHPSAAVHILAELGRRTREMIEKVRGIRNVNEVIEQTRSRWDVVAGRVATISASRAFLMANLVFFGTWITVNLLNGRDAFDPAPFGLLGFVVSIESLLVSLFVLNSQNQEGDRDRVRADLDYQVNLKAHLEVMQLHQKLDKLTAAIRGENGSGDKPGKDGPAA
jgi:CRP/FNR family cyclic AMP-dependent transcriptional regulator